MRGEQGEAAELVDDVLGDGPGDSEPVEGRCASAQLVDNDEAVFGRSLQGGMKG